MAELLLSVGPPHEPLSDSYIRPVTQRPNFAAVGIDENIPIIDLGFPDKSQIAAQVGQGCQSYGFFQVVNHGISDELIQDMQAIAAEFFRLPAEEKLRLYSDDPEKKVRLSTSFNVKKETVHNWRDYLRFHCHPFEEYLAVWPSKPLAFRDVVSKYYTEVRRLGFLLLDFISLSLGLDHDYIKKVLGEQEQHMAINFKRRLDEF